MGFVKAIGRSNSLFTTSLTLLLKLVSAHEGALARYRLVDPEYDLTEPDGVSKEDWLLAVSALRTLVPIDQDEDSEGWIEDVRDVLASTPEGVPAGWESSLQETLVRLVRGDDEARWQARFTQARDWGLPTLEEATFTLDLRVVPGRGENRATPVIMCRIELDESVGGVSHLAFRVPYRLLTKLPGEVEKLQDQARWLRASLSNETSPVDAWPAELGRA